MKKPHQLLLGLALAGAPSLASADPLSAQDVCERLSVTAYMVADIFEISSDQPLSCNTKLVVAVDASHAEGVIDLGAVGGFLDVNVRNDDEAVVVKFIPESGDPFELRNPSWSELTAIRGDASSDDSGSVSEGPPDRVVFNFGK